MKYRVQRNVVAVQWSIVEADTPEQAMEEADSNGHQWSWNTSSENDPEITDAVLVKEAP